MVVLDVLEEVGGLLFDGRLLGLEFLVPPGPCGDFLVHLDFHLLLLLLHPPTLVLDLEVGLVVQVLELVLELLLLVDVGLDLAPGDHDNVSEVLVDHGGFRVDLIDVLDGFTGLPAGF